MDLSSYGSALELLTVFHFVYYLGKDHGGRDYYFTLTNLVFRSKQKYKEIFQVVDSKFLIAENEIPKIKEPIGQYTAKDLRNECKEKIEKLRNDFSFSQEEFFNDYQEANRADGFGKVSFFLALYCFSLLLLTGLIDYLSSPIYIYQYLSSLNLVLFLLIIAIFLNDIFDKLRTSSVKGVYILIGFVFISLGGIAYYYCNHDIYVSGNNSWIKDTAILSSLFLAISNILLYIVRYVVQYFVFLFKAKRKVANIENSLSKIIDLQDSIKNFDNKIKTIKDL